MVGKQNNHMKHAKSSVYVQRKLGSLTGVPSLYPQVLVPQHSPQQLWHVTA